MPANARGRGLQELLETRRDDEEEGEEEDVPVGASGERAGAGGQGVCRRSSPARGEVGEHSPLQPTLQLVLVPVHARLAPPPPCPSTLHARTHAPPPPPTPPPQ